MAKQLNISFKENDIELELYNWLKGKLNPSSFAKEILYQGYLADRGDQVGVTTNESHNSNSKETKEETPVIKEDSWSMD